MREGRVVSFGWAQSAAAVAFAIVAATTIVAAEEPSEGWRPQSEYKGEWDWVQMTSGEWLKGEITAMYNDDLQFDSDEFDDVTLGWDDIAQIHTSQVINVGLTGRRL